MMSQNGTNLIIMTTDLKVIKIYKNNHLCLFRHASLLKD